MNTNFISRCIPGDSAPTSSIDGSDQSGSEKKIPSDNGLYITQFKKSSLHTPDLMRWIGILILAAGILSFMFQGVATVSFMTRHWLFLGMTVVFSVTGMILGLRCHEMKGARTFLGLTVAALPVLCSQLGGMILMVVAPPSRVLPQLFSAPATSTTSAIFTIITTVVIMLPLVFFGFKVFVQSQALQFTVLYTISGLCLMLPVRGSTTAGIILLLLSACILLTDTILHHKNERLHTAEGALSRLLLGAPVLIMIIRGIYYESTAFYSASVIAVAGSVLFFIAARHVPSLRTFLQLAGTITLLFAVLRFSAPLFGTDLSAPLRLYWQGISAMTVFLVLSPVITSVRSRRTYRTIAACSAVGTVILVHSYGITPQASLPAIGVGTLLIIIGSVCGEKVTFFGGVAAGSIGIVNCCTRIMHYHGNLTWIFLAVAGTVILIVASLVESNKVPFVKAVKKWYAPFKSGVPE